MANFSEICLCVKDNLYLLSDDGRRECSEIVNLPGGVPQQSLRSSMCSTSSPINQDPKETSSLAYLCRTCLRIQQLSRPLYNLEMQMKFVVLDLKNRQNLTGLLICRLLNPSKWRTTGLLHGGSTCYRTHQTSSVQVRGIELPCNDSLGKKSEVSHFSIFTEGWW